MICFIAILVLPVLPAFADHGALTSTDRDGWVDSAIQDVVDAGLASQPVKPVNQLTNLEVAQMTCLAAQSWMAQDRETLTSGGSDTKTQTGTADRSLQKLVDEFKIELEAMDLDVSHLVDRYYDILHRNEKFETLQKEYLKQTGTNLAGYSRAYFNTYRGFGPNAIYGPMDYNDILFGDIRLKSVPVPFVLFNTDLRLTRTIGLLYAEPVNPNLTLRWISLTNTNEVANLTVGDFYRSYTPLTFWNNEIPVYTMIEPASYNRARKDLEELVYMDHGPDWRMRGFEGASDQAVINSDVFSSFHLQAMGGIVTPESQYVFANDYAGSEAAIDLFGDKFELKGSGLMLWADTNSADYYPGITPPDRQYQVGSLSAKTNIPFGKAVSFSASGEYAYSFYQNDSVNLQDTLKDWALEAKGALAVEGVQLSGKYLSNGPYFYSPGAQTNRFSPDLAGSSFNVLDDGLNDYLSGFAFQGVNQQIFEPYDRMSENILPYGDATPDREGLILGFTADIGKGGWLKPQASYVVKMKELQPNYVLTGTGNEVLPVDSAEPVTSIRSFGGYEGALTVNLAKALEGTPKTCALSGDYKHQTTDLGTGASSFIVNTYIICADIGPFPQVPLFEGLILSAAYEQAASSGYEYTLNTPAFTQAADIPTLAEYYFYFNNLPTNANPYNQSYDPKNALYKLQLLDFTKTSWAFGLKCPVSRTIVVHGDWFINGYTWSNVPGYDRREQIWRATCEVSF